MKARKTRDRILDTSIILFNERKASNVSTVQISAEMGISPGNLYYYYDNKEEVIRYIWSERMKNEAEALVRKYAAVRSASDFIGCIRAALEHCLKYRFFYTELTTLFANDNMLIDMYRDLKDKIRAAAVEMHIVMARENMLPEPDRNDIEAAADNGVALLVGLVMYCDVMAVEGQSMEVSASKALIRMVRYMIMMKRFGSDMSAELEKALERMPVSVAVPAAGEIE